MQAKRSCKLSWRLHRYLRQIALRGSCSDRSPLYDVRNPASNIPKDITSEVMLSRTSNRRCPDGASCEHTMKKGEWSGRSLVAIHQKGFWWRQTGSNRRPHACKARALPAELCPRSRKHEACQPIERSSVPGWLAEPKLAPPSPPTPKMGFGVTALRSLARAKAGGPGKT